MKTYFAPITIFVPIQITEDPPKNFVATINGGKHFKLLTPPFESEFEAFESACSEAPRMLSKHFFENIEEEVEQT